MTSILAASVLLWWNYATPCLFYKITVGTTATPVLCSYTVYAPTQSLQIDGLDPKTQYKFVETAYDFSGRQTSISNQVSQTPITTP